MYHVHFGLERGLFDEGIAADAAVFRNSKHDRLIADFKLALASRSSSVLLHGPAGVGKTTLTSAALRATSTRLALAWLNGTPTNAAELLESILLELGIGTARTTRIERLQLWRQFQGEMRATDSRLFIVAERTEDLSPQVLHALDQLTAPDAIGNPGANLVLLGHAGIHEHLGAPVLDSLRQRIRLRAELEPFTEAELQDYLRHQVAHAGGNFEQIFAPDAVAALYSYSNGVARLVNTLCESALDIAAAQHQKRLSPDLVARTAVSRLGLAEPAGVARPAAPAPPVSAPPVETRAAPRSVLSAPPAVVIERRSEPRVPAGAAEAPPAPPPLSRAPSPALSAARASAAAPHPIEGEFDGGATDVADVAVSDFLLLTDAVEPPVASVPPKQDVAPAPKAIPSVPQAATAPQAKTVAPAPAPAAAAPARVEPAAKPVARVETAYAAARRAPKPTPAPVAPAGPRLTPLPHAIAAKPKVPAASAPAAPDSDGEDALRVTDGAKSIDDFSEIDAERMFSAAALDLAFAALASAAEGADDETTAPAVEAPPRHEAAKAAAPAPSRPSAAKGGAPAEENPLDPFGLGDDAPLELIDDSTFPPNARKPAAR